MIYVPCYIKRIGCLFLILFLSGCARWVLVGGRHISASHEFEVELPDGWRKDNRARDALQLTRDGFTLQRISITRKAVDETTFPEHLQAQKLANLITEVIRLSPFMTNQQILETADVVVSGRSAFKVIYTFKTNRGLPMKGASYGVVADKYYYFLIYVAPARHYFEKDLSTFENIKNSFRILPD